MDSRADSRGQSTLVGFILLFGILVIAFSSYQAVVVPNQNAEVEFNHNQDVQGDMQELRNSLTDIRSVRLADDPPDYRIVSEHRPTRVQLGTSYPSRLVALNPPRPSGTLRTVEPSSEVQIRDATVKDEGKLPDGVDTSPLFESHQTTFLSYQPNYNEYRNAPDTNFEHSLLYNDFSDETLTVSDQNIITANSNQIDLVLYDGEFTRSGSQAQTLSPRTVDGPTDVRIEPENDEFQLALPTNAPDRWRESLEDIDHASVNDDESSNNEIILDLDISELSADFYILRMSRVSFDGRGTEQPEVFTPIQELEPRHSPDESFNIVEASVTEESTAPGQPGVEQILFDWELSGTTNIELQVYDENSNLVGSETVISASTNGEQRVDITDGSNSGGQRQPRPVDVEATIQSTDETCRGTIGSGDGDGPFEICN